MPGLNLSGSARTSASYVQPSNPPSASGTTATSLAFGGAQTANADVGKTAAVGGVSVGVISLVLLVLIWHSLPR